MTLNSSYRKIINIIGIICAIALIAYIYFIIKDYHIQQLERSTKERIKIYHNEVSDRLARFDFLPLIISRDKELISLASTQPNKANQILTSIKEIADIDEVYILDNTGTAIASSNWQDALSFVGKNYSFRSYFQKALLGQTARFYGIGATTKKPGFFIAHGIKKDNEVIAVLVVKVAFNDLEQKWRTLNENIFITNEDDVTILSNHSEWKYRILTPLTQKQLDLIQEQKQFDNEPLSLLIENLTQSSLTIDNVKYLYYTMPFSEHNWHMYYLVPESVLNTTITNTWLAIALIILMISLVFLLIKIIKARTALNVSKAESKQLKHLNTLLRDEVAHRKKIEKKLEYTNKIAAMGELSTAIVHELSQPLSAAKNYIATALNSTNQEIHNRSLSKIEILINKATTITKQLKFFSMSNKKKIEVFDIYAAINSALIVVSPAIEEHNINLVIRKPGKPYMINASQICIEQVFTNIIHNACYAMSHSTIRNLVIEFEENYPYICTTITDTGVGLSSEDISQIFEPFYTNLNNGVGLGLAISKNIIVDFNGTLTAHNNTDMGAHFIIKLPIHNESK